MPADKAATIERLQKEGPLAAGILYQVFHEDRPAAGSIQLREFDRKIAEMKVMEAWKN